MATLKEIIYNIKNLQGRGQHTDDLQLSNRQLAYIVNHFRSTLATQKADKKASLDGFYQTLNELKLSKSKEFRPTDPDVYVLKSDTMPSLAVSHRSGNMIQFVGLRDEYIGFQKTELHLYNLDLENPYVRNVYFINNDKLYIATKNRSFLREVLVKAVFDDPLEVLKHNNNDIDVFDEFNFEYPIPGNSLSQLNSLIIDNEYRWMNITQADDENNGKDDKQ